MPSHPPPPHDPWQWLSAWQQTWLAGMDPGGAGRHWRQARLARLIERARRDSPLYARRARTARCLDDLEPIGKAELMAHFDDWATDRRITRRGAEAHLREAAPGDGWLGRYLLWTSSGTSGEPGLFVQDAASLAAYDALDGLRMRPGGPWRPTLASWALGRHFAYVGAIGGPYAGHVSLQRLRRIAPPPWTPVVDCLSVLDPIRQIADRLRTLQPQVLITYPSCADALARVQAEDEPSLRLDEVWLGGEQLGAARRLRIAQAFGCSVRNSYGASEFLSMAFECAHGRLHLNDDWVILEGVDAQGRPVPPGTQSHSTLLTNLANHTQPLLRYVLTDRVRFDPQPCPCGGALPVIEVQGRNDEVLSLPSRYARTATLLPLALETVLEEQAGIPRFQLVLRPGAVLELRLPDPAGPDGDAGAFERGRTALLKFLAHHQVFRVRVQRGNGPPTLESGSGKLRRVIDLSHPAGRKDAHSPVEVGSESSERGAGAGRSANAAPAHCHPPAARRC